MKNEATKILTVDNLKLHYSTAKGFFSKKEIVKAVDDISFNLLEGETLGIVGESGSGKSSICRLVLNLISKSSGKITWFDKDLDTFNKKQMKEFRRKVQIIFQDPYGSLDPRMTIGSIIKEPLDIFNKKLLKKDKEKIITELMNYPVVNAKELVLQEQ